MRGSFIVKLNAETECGIEQVATLYLQGHFAAKRAVIGGVANVFPQAATHYFFNYSI